MPHTPIKSYGAHFAARSVAQNYVHRPQYSPEVYDTLLTLLPDTSRAVLDAGCGPGKIALGLRAFVDRIDAVDPSEEMIAAGRALPGGGDPKIAWICARLEDAELRPPYGLVACGVSFHWMDADVALSRFADVLAPGGAFALISGDAPADAPWHDAELETFSDFIERLQGKRPEFLATSRAFLDQPLLEHRRFRRLGAKITAPHPVRQPVEDYIACQHSRATWSVDFMGAEMAAEFDARLRALLLAHASDGMLDYVVQTRVEWGLPLPA
ncbi:MAG TPA: methyltransferase domain-containing protein [Rhizomicrobium sp.]|nr:methyltransferase domain-containing protein [Rhizomicrobium sp.]